MREQRQGHLVVTEVGAGVGVLRRPGQADAHGVDPVAGVDAVAVAPVVEHGDAERRLGDVDEAVCAHLELGGVPRRGGVRRPAHRPELHAARGLLGVHVDGEHHRQQVLVVVPVEGDLHVEPR